MRAARVPAQRQYELIMECRSSGMSDAQWCLQQGINPGTFYNWVSKLRKQGYIFPESEAKSNATPNLQEVVKVDLIPCEESSQIIEQNVSIPTISSESIVAAELVMGNVTLRLYNNANEQLIEKTIQCIGGIKHAW